MIESTIEVLYQYPDSNVTTTAAETQCPKAAFRASSSYPPPFKGFFHSEFLPLALNFAATGFGRKPLYAIDMAKIIFPFALVILVSCVKEKKSIFFENISCFHPTSEHRTIYADTLGHFAMFVPDSTWGVERSLKDSVSRMTLCSDNTQVANCIIIDEAVLDSSSFDYLSQNDFFKDDTTLTELDYGTFRKYNRECDWRMVVYDDNPKRTYIIVNFFDKKKSAAYFIYLSVYSFPEIEFRICTLEYLLDCFVIY